MRSPTDAESLAIVRQALMHELATINQYQAACDAAPDAAVRAFMAHLMGKEKEHVAELTELLNRLDPEPLRPLDARPAFTPGSGDLLSGVRNSPGYRTVGSLLGLAQ